jgi:hypothetical protein
MHGIPPLISISMKGFPIAAGSKPAFHGTVKVT